MAALLQELLDQCHGYTTAALDWQGQAAVAEFLCEAQCALVEANCEMVKMLAEASCQLACASTVSYTHLRAHET